MGFGVAGQTPIPGRSAFNTGGPVGQPAPAVAAQGPTPAVIVADDQAMSRLLAGGRQAMLNFLGDNGAAVRQRLGVSFA